MADIEGEIQRWQREQRINELPPLIDSMGYEHQPLYTPANGAADYLDALGLPGEFPFTRGVYAGMYRKAPWRINQYAGFGTAEDTNQRWKLLLARGQMVFNLAFDLPTHMGYDSDDPFVEDEVGRTGIAIDSLRDFEVLTEGLPMVPLFFNTVGPAAIILAMYLAVGEQKGMAPASIMGAFTNDILTVYVCRGTWIFPPCPSLRLITDMIEYCCRHMPRFYPLNIQGVYFRSAGSTIPQEVGYTFADALTYVDGALERGLPIDDFAPRLSFFLACGPEIFAEAAKFRAARRLWARLMRDRYHAAHKDSLRFRVTGATGGRYFQAVEPLNNLTRAAYGILGAVLGGAQATFVAGYDEAYAIPNEESALLGLRGLQILQEETDVARTIDPLGGSYYVEHLTDYIERESLKYLEDINAHGGTVRCIETGYMRHQLDEHLYRQMEKMRNGQTVLVGVNKYAAPDAKEPDIAFHQHDPAVTDRQRQRLHDLRRKRSGERVRACLDAIRRAAEGQDNLIPHFVEAVKAYATLGEIVGTLRDVFGTFKDPNVRF
jgi:methylmalonyl-CoA mutase N-terminal domain/subunit